MLTKEISKLRCPYCGGKFCVVLSLDKKQNHLNYGIIRCYCSKFPVVEGILILKKGNITNIVIKLIKQKRKKDAINILCGVHGTLNVYAEKLVDFNIIPEKMQESFLLGFKRLKNRNFFAELSNGNDFHSVLKSMKQGVYEEYFFHKYSLDTFAELAPFLSMIKDGYVLDVGCGMGNFAFIVKELFPDVKLFLCDFNFHFLFVAKKYFVRDATFVCNDCENGMPFSDSMFSSIFASDFFCTIRNKKRLVSEFERMITQKGNVVLSHLHNKEKNIWGKNLSSEGYVSLFDLKHVMLVGEKNVRGKKTLNLQKSSNRYISPECADNRNFELVASNSKEAYKKYESNKGVLIKNIQENTKFVFNPLYDVSETADKYILNRKKLSAWMIEENPDIRTRLKRKITFDKNSKKKVWEWMIENFYVIRCPENFYNENDVTKLIKKQ